MRFPRPRSRASTHFLWLLSAAAFLFAGVIWSGSKAHAVELTPAEAKSQEAERANADRVALLGRLQLAGIASRRAGPPRSRVTKPKLPPPPTPSEQNRALARYMAWVGADSVQAMVSQSGSQLSQQVLADDRITLASGYGDVASGRVDPRVLALLLYLAEAHGQVTVSCLITGHSHFVAQSAAETNGEAPAARLRALLRPRGRHQLARRHPDDRQPAARRHHRPRGARDPLAPVGAPASQVISLLDLSGPSFRLPDHGDHLHVGY